MHKKLIALLVIMVFIISCQGNSKADDLKNLTQDFTTLDTKFQEKESKIKSYKEYQAFKVERDKEFGELLDKYKDSARSEAIDIIKAKIFVKVENLDAAGKLINEVISDGGDLQSEAKMVKVQVLIGEKKYDDAYFVFSEIENDVSRADNFYWAMLTFSFESSDKSVRKNYSEKLLNDEQLPEKFKKYEYMFYANLASIAKEEKDIAGAKEILMKAIEITNDPRGKKSLESELAQIEFLGKKAPSISAETWVNSTALSLDKLKGKVVIIDFWAPWCSPCRAVIPGLIEEYGKRKDDGLVVIGFTKLYGSYRDDMQNAGKVDRDKEIELIKGFVERFKIDYPVAISDEGADFDSYMISGIPTMIFIDRDGNVDYIKIGSGNHNSVKEKIEELLGNK
ncbi:MAG: TlpA family protein disulfide reductase [Candidatus Aminicenantes bacterium]|nr:TlpA family protein disulfide reductase [Candidatus Aminicenantes bacterium]